MDGVSASWFRLRNFMSMLGTNNTGVHVPNRKEHAISKLWESLYFLRSGLFPWRGSNHFLLKGISTFKILKCFRSFKVFSLIRKAFFCRAWFCCKVRELPCHIWDSDRLVAARIDESGGLMIRAWLFHLFKLVILHSKRSRSLNIIHFDSIPSKCCCGMVALSLSASTWCL